jgi:hypothetical protein
LRETLKLLANTSHQAVEISLFSSLSRTIMAETFGAVAGALSVAALFNNCADSFG